jgi:hypothetical protein
MRRIIATIGATLAVAAAMAVSAIPASAGDLNTFGSRHSGVVHFDYSDGSVRE